MTELSDYRRVVSDPLERQLRAENARLREALKELEHACDMLASTRPQAAYDAMIAGGQSVWLLGLDRARCAARAALAEAEKE